MTSKKCTKCGEEKPLSEFYKRAGAKDGYRATCKVCRSIYIAGYREKNGDKMRAWALKSFHKHEKEHRAGKKRWREANKEKIAAWHAENYQQNKNVILAQHKKWNANNRGRRAFLIKQYTSAKLHRTPQWANLGMIAAIYEAASAQGKEVDHYYPLQGETVSGLHVPFNLQLLTKSENCSKHNKHPELWIGS